MKRLILHYEFMRDVLSRDPLTIKQLADKMEAQFFLNYQYVRREVDELISLNKIKKVKHNNETLLLWTEESIKFDYEHSKRVIELDKQYLQFHTVPSKVRQMKLPMYVLQELGNKLADLGEKIELMLEVKAICSNGVWYKVKRSE